ncbi:MAG: thioesterase superfamily protein [Comamonadaceae bacterium]|nr:MAG: thioesterase superfamily protein [Comamonadaceae bacterium]
MSTASHFTPERFNEVGAGHLPGYMGIVIKHVGPGVLEAELPVAKHLLAPNGYLHAGSVVTLADTAAGYGCIANLPENATSFTTIELKSNHMGTARDGHITCQARMAHGGRTTQVWDVVVRSVETSQTIALFRCTQMILYPR